MSTEKGRDTSTVNAGQGTQPDGGDTSKADAEPRFTQADFDKKLQQVLAEKDRRFQRKEEDARKQAIADFAASLGLDADDPEALKEHFSKLVGKEDEAKSHERKLKTMETRLAEATAKLAAIDAERKDNALRARIAELGQAAGCDDTELLYDHLTGRKLVGWDQDEIIAMGADGKPAYGVSLEQLIKDTLTKKPRLLGAAPAIGGGSRPSPTSQGNGTPDLKTKEGRLAALAGLYTGRG